MIQSSLRDPSGKRLSDDAIRAIVERILRVARPERVILFGSAATDEMTQDSDIDLLVVEKSVPDVRKEAVRIRAALAGLPSAFDVIVMTSERFEETRGVIGGIAWPASRYGRVIHEAACQPAGISSPMT